MSNDGTLENIYEELCSYGNLETAFNRARRGKTLKPYVIEFEEKLKNNLTQLRSELLMQTYHPQPLKTFILRDPKTRKISKSAFRDRVVITQYATSSNLCLTSASSTTLLPIE